MKSNFVISIFLTYLLQAVLGDDLSKGWNSNIDWVKLEDGLEIAKSQKKPLMLIIHKSWCGACKALKPRFADSIEIEGLSQKFVMVNVMDNEEPSDKKYSPDGGYIPRILFINSDGSVNKDIYNFNGNKDYKYYYPEVTQILSSMREALKQMGSNGGVYQDEL